MFKTDVQLPILAYRSLLAKLAEFAYPITDEMDIEDYLDEFFGVSESQMSDEYLNTDQEEFFWEWLWYDVPLLENKTILETYIVEREERLTKNETDYLIGMQKSYRSCFEIIGIVKNRGLAVRDIFTHEAHFISEVNGSKFFQVGDVFYARMIFLKNRKIFSGSTLQIEGFEFTKAEKALDIEHKVVAPKMGKRDFLKRYGGPLYQILHLE